MKKQVDGQSSILIKSVLILEGVSCEDVILAHLCPKLRIKWDSSLHEYEIIAKNAVKKEEIIMYSIKVGR